MSPSNSFTLVAAVGVEDGSVIPPDTFGTVGPEHVMTILNSGVRIHSRSGSLLCSNSLLGFWNNTNTESAFDPRAAYDPNGNRWIATSAGNPNQSSSILIGVSKDNTPTNGWWIWDIKSDSNSNYFADFPTLGFNKDWIVVQANMKNLTNAPLDRSHIWVFNKTSLYSGMWQSPALFVQTNALTAGGEYPTVTYDTSLSTVYLLQNVNGSNGCLRLYSISGLLGAETLNGADTPVYIKVNDTWQDQVQRDGFHPEIGGSLISIADARIASVVYRNGSLWAAQTIFLPATNATRGAIQWWQINPATSNVVQRGRIDTANMSFDFPSIAVNQFNDVIIGYASFATNQYPSGNYSFRAFNDAPNTLRGSRILQSGNATYPDGRWGDYSATVVDPVNDADFWTIQEYSTTNFTVNWAVMWGQVKVARLTNDDFSTAITLTNSSGTLAGTTERATREAGEPSHGGGSNTRSVWYQWTPPTNGYAVFQLTNTYWLGSFDSVIAVYSHTNVSSLTLVTNHHGGLGNSQVVFDAFASNIYRVAVAGFSGSMGTFDLHWTQPDAPYFTTHPKSLNVVAGSNVTFSALAFGRPDPAYQWQFNGSHISGANFSTYTRTNAQTNDTGSYRVIATNISGTATSLVAGLFVHPSAAATMSEWQMSVGQFRFHVFGVTNSPYVVQASTNLSVSNWVSLETNIVSFTFTNFLATNYPYRFFRVLNAP